MTTESGRFFAEPFTEEETGSTGWYVFDRYDAGFQVGPDDLTQGESIEVANLLNVIDCQVWLSDVEFVLVDGSNSPQATASSEKVAAAIVVISEKMA
jgi:hypothetical protein